MRALFLRTVPDDVVRRLETLAARASTSVNAVAVSELAEVTRRVDNLALLDALPEVGAGTSKVAEDVEAGRSGR